MYELQRILGTRIVATPAALDKLKTPAKALVLRLAPDELFIDQPIAAEAVADTYAIVVPDSSFVGVWLAADQAHDFLERTCEWELPRQRPTFAQGMVAGLTMKLWLETDRLLIMVPAPFAAELEERLA